MTVFLRRKNTSNQLSKRRSVTSRTSVSRRWSRAKSLVPKKVTRQMVEDAVNKDTEKLIGMFLERKRWKSMSDLNGSTKEDSKEDEKLAGLVVDNERLTRDLESLTLKLRDVERQLIYERAFYAEQKGQYARALRTRVLTRNVKTQTFEVDFVYESEKVSSLISELRTVRELYSKQKSTVAEVCEKYLRMRTFKEYLLQTMVKTEERHKRVLEEVLERFDEERIAFATADRQGLPHQAQAKLVEVSSKLAYNNAALQMQLHQVMSSKARVCPRTLSSDLFIYTALKEIRDLSGTEGSMWKMMDNRRVWYPDLDSGDEGVQGKFISFPVEVAGTTGYKITPLFKIEDVEEDEEEDDQDIQEVEVDNEGLAPQQWSESVIESNKNKPLPPRSDSAPDIIRATF